ncbi:MAG: fasciclin domain-containing protein [Gemmatimonadaceae bacterium]|nr:fasciclin domain-containing protein [Acetobacteraceae bacterium]
MLNSTRDLTSFAGLVQQSGLRNQVDTARLTVFAPNNVALSRLSYVTQMLAGQSANSSPDFPKLQTLVRAHLAPGLHPESEMRGKVELPTLAGTSIAIDGTTQRGIILTAGARDVNLSGMQLMRDIAVTGPAIQCDNGWVYPIDNALIQ